jgi:hypothetical protein
MAPVAGVGYLIANDILSDIAAALYEPVVSSAVPGGGIAPGTQTVPVWDPAMYVGAQIIVGTIGGNAEVILITAVNSGVSFTATFANTHTSGERIIGATFPVQQPADPFFLQSEVLGYLSTALNDFLRDCPLAIAVEDITVTATQQNAALPADCMEPVRVGAYGVPLRETSQSSLDAMFNQWTQAAATGPMAFFRDKTGLQKVGIWPRANDATPLEVVYRQRSAQTLGLADGFLLPDPFMIFPKFRALSMCYSKDGEQRNPGLAKYWAQRYDMGVKVCTMLLDVVNDTSAAG